MNEADSHRLASAMEQLGICHSDDAESADIVVLNTCVVRQQAEDAATGYITQMKPMKQRNPDKVLGVMGCMVGVRGNSPLKALFTTAALSIAAAFATRVERRARRD